MSNLKITLTRSLNSCKKDQIATANALGLRRVGHTTVQPNNAATQGKIAKISHLVKFVEA